MGLVAADNPVLRAVASPVTAEYLTTQEFRTLRYWMEKLAKKRGTLGIAAPQLGVSVRVMLVNGTLMINPEKLCSYDNKFDVELEGCLSLPGVLVHVKRHNFIQVRYVTDGQIVQKAMSGRDARIFQHELDHLNGKLITDYREVEDEARGYLSRPKHPLEFR
jgi:peptide deformylase